MRRSRTVTAALTALALGGGLALVGATSASAEPTGHWGTFTLAGQGKDYTGTVSMAGFPETTFTSNSRQSTVISGNSTWQAAATPVGAAGFGTSRGNTYLNQRPLADNDRSPSVTTYTFAEPAPGAQSWAFVLGDIDADQVTITATDAAGNAVSAADLGYGGTDPSTGSYNSCGSVVAGGWPCGRATADDPTPGSDKPTWTPGANGGTLVGNPGASDTAGASAWFSPVVALKTLTISYQQRSGFPVYQTWFTVKTASLTGTATLDGAPLPGRTVTVQAPRGTIYTTVTDAAGNYSFPDLPQIPGYTVTVAPPAGTNPDPSLVTQTVTLVGTDGTADFAFRAPAGTASIIGQVVGADGSPAADVPVVITDPNSPEPITTVTNDAGSYTASGLTPETPVTVAVGGADPETVTTGEAGAAPAPVREITTNAVGTVSGTVVLDSAPQAGVTVQLLDGASVVATTVTDADGGYAFTTVAGTYTVRVVQPRPDAELASEDGGPVTITAGTEQTRDFAFTTPPVPEAVVTSADGRVVDTAGDPAPGRTVTATPTEADAGGPVTATTTSDGSYTLDGLNPSTDYTVTVSGSDATVDFTSGLDETDVVTVPDVVVAAPTAPTPTPTPTPTATPTVGTAPTTAPVAATGSGPSTGALAYTGADIGPGIVAAAVLVLLGTGLLTVRSVRHRRRVRPRD